MKKITTIAVATALLGLAACSAENTAPEAENTVAAEDAAPADAAEAAATAEAVEAVDAADEATVDGVAVDSK
jgi:hypothetical protein